MAAPASPDELPLLAGAALPPVFVARALPPAALERLGRRATVDVWDGDGPPGPERLLERCRGVAGLLSTPSEPIGAELLDACPGIAVVSNLAVGYDNVDVAELTRRGIPLGHTPGVLTEATADLAMALVLVTARRVVEARDAVLEGRWKGWDPGFMLGLELSGATLGVVGLGRIGLALARRALGFGMHVLGWSRGPKRLEGELAALEQVPLGELLERSDVVSLHVPLDDSTRHLIGAGELGAMRREAILVNTSRGAVVDQGALVQALRSGAIAAAGLDVVETEPIALDDPLLALPNCVVLPHIGSATVKARTAMAELAVDNLLAGLAGERLPACVNPQVYRS